MLQTISSFVTAHAPQVLVTVALVVYSLSKKKLTPDGIAAAIVTAVIHMLHPWSVFFYLLVTFFMAGTIATKVHHKQKALLTQSSQGGSGGEASHGRSAAQVFANALPAGLLILLDVYLHYSGTPSSSVSSYFTSFFSSSAKTTSELVLPVGIICSYAAATADTLSSELGILSPSAPFLITQPWKSVPKGTNGGVTITGLAWGLFGGFLTGVTSILLLPSSVFSSESLTKLRLVAGVSVAGLFGSVLDSVLGAVCQATVEDKASGRVVEGENGRRVLVGAGAGGSRVQRGMDLLNNNGVNFAMAMGTGAVGMLVFAGLAS
ncbi:hypothetical protein AAFC00_006809 [Neodothiora populina]|uniref:Uncharacterized protein n=1 Tax=Neodothiora populina TaxID=2781224 RepID=A0ABR3PB82_9PEZI